MGSVLRWMSGAALVTAAFAVGLIAIGPVLADGFTTLARPHG